MSMVPSSQNLEGKASSKTLILQRVVQRRFLRNPVQQPGLPQPSQKGSSLLKKGERWSLQRSRPACMHRFEEDFGLFPRAPRSRMVSNMPTGEFFNKQGTLAH